MRLLAVPACFAALIAMAAPAQADTGSDADFLAGLNSAGISYKSGPDAVGTGRKACELMDQGHPQADVVKAMVDQNPGFTTDGATKFVEISENKLCPQHNGGAPAPAASSSSAPQPPPAPTPAGPNANGASTYDPGTAGSSGGAAPAGGGG
ncbi:MAG: DUF732 domain-containing protein [Mycobacterium sp.]|nr:DUF732 domain-containing protein [Mycobacterium sp.]MBV9722629.1 DUF732 domain-containing protein [Mycobacterium sp.]